MANKSDSAQVGLSPVAAIVVCHNIGARVRETVAPLFAAVDQIILIDNASGDDTLRILREIAEQPRTESNGGATIRVIARADRNLAAGQNEGIRAALGSGSRSILLLDHDSVIERGAVELLQNALAADRDSERVGIVAPHIVDVKSRRPARYPKTFLRFVPWRRGFGKDVVIRDILEVIASGSLIPAKVFTDVGLMDENLGLDYVDKDFCLRLRRHGYTILAVRDAVLYHHLGESKDYTWLGFRITTTNHPAFRMYYVYRNRFRVWMKHGLRFPAFVLYDLGGILYDLWRIIVFEESKMEKLRAVARGTRAAFRKEVGVLAN